MSHLSFYWLPENKHLLIQGLETEFAQLVELSIRNGKISMPPIPNVVIKIQQLCTQSSSTVADIAACLTDDPGLAAAVIRVANSVIFNRRNITCYDLNTAVARLGIVRTRDIVTAQAIEQLKLALQMSQSSQDILTQSARASREFAASMVLVTQSFKQLYPLDYHYLESEKALLTGLLADIGLFCLVNEYHLYLENGHYLDESIALQIFQSKCAITSQRVLSHWGFDNDFVEVASNQLIINKTVPVSYLDIARITNHLLLFRKQDDELDEHEVEINTSGAEVLYYLSNLSTAEFDTRLKQVIHNTGF